MGFDRCKIGHSERKGGQSGSSQFWLDLEVAKRTGDGLCWWLRGGGFAG